MVMHSKTNKSQRIEEILSKVEEAEAISQEEEELVEFTERFALTGFSIAIYRMEPRTNRPIWVGRVLPAEATHEMIQQEYGGGKYQLRVLDAKGKYVTSQTIELEGIAKPKESNVSTGTAPARAADSQVEILQQQLARNQELLLAILSNNQNGNSEKATLGEIAQVVTSLHSMMPQQSPGDPSVILNALTKGIEIATGQNKGSEKPAWYEIAKDVLSAVPQVLQTFRPNIPPNGNGEQTMLKNTPETEMRLKLEFLKRKCLLGKSPEIFCDYILDNADDDERVTLAAFIAQGLDKLFELDPVLKSEPYTSWFTTLYDGLKDGLFGQDNTGRISGDTGDIAGDGAGSKTGDS